MMKTTVKIKLKGVCEFVVLVGPMALVTARKRSLRRLCFYRCLSVHRRGCAWLLGGIHGCQGVCMVAGGVCMVARGRVWLPGGVHGCQGCAWLPGGMHGCQRACMAKGVHGKGGGMCSEGGHVWQRGAYVAKGRHAWWRWGHAWDTTRYGDTINERAVRILLECILVFYNQCRPLRLRTSIWELYILSNTNFFLRRWLSSNNTSRMTSYLNHSLISVCI